MKLSKDMEAKVLALAGVQPAKRAKSAKPTLVEAAFVPPGTFIVPLHVYSGDNSRGHQARIGRAGHERTVCCRVFALGHPLWADCVAHLQAGGLVRVTLTRLGSRRMDYSNVVAAMKYCQDSAALFLGRDDADAQLRWDYGQAPGGASGVRVDVERV